MTSWITWRAFFVAFCMVALAQSAKLFEAGFTIEGVLVALLASIIGGVFWGAIGLFLYRRFKA